MVLNVAKEWMFKYVIKNPSTAYEPQNLSIYACLLYKLGKANEASGYMHTAVKLEVANKQEQANNGMQMSLPSSLIRQNKGSSELQNLYDKMLKGERIW